MSGDVAYSEIRCKGRGFQIQSPAKFADPAKNLLIVTDIGNFTRRNVRTPSHFTIVVVRKILIHQVVPFTDKLPFEVTERESNHVTLNALYPAYYKQDLEGFFYYEISNVVGLVFISKHRAFVFARQWLLGYEEGRLSVHSSGPRKAYNIDRCRPYREHATFVSNTEFPRFEDCLTHCLLQRYCFFLI